MARRGSYLGGSTIITAWGSGWSRDATSPVEKKYKKVVGTKTSKFKKQFRNYARTCGALTIKNKPWSLVPNSVKEHFNNDMEAIRSAVLESPSYKQVLSNHSAISG